MSNLNKINNFFQNDKNSILINPTNDQVLIFYKYLFQFFAEKNNVQIHKNEHGLNNDLFNLQKKVIIRHTTSSNLIENTLNSDDKFILVTDYKNYKKFNNKFIGINGYDYIKDLKIFLQEYLDFYDEKLFNIISSNICYIESEIAKFEINPSAYRQAFFDNLINDKIKEIRVKMRKNHANKNSLYEKYELIKLEYFYKKFSFLIF